MHHGSSNFSFFKNTARQHGGGIYFQSMDYSIHQPCFIYRDLHTPKSKFNFSGNRANDGRGDHIYVSSFTSCNLYCQSESPYDSIGNFTFTKPHNHSTATLPTNFSLNDTGPVSVFPGIPFRLPLLVKDMEGNILSNMSYEAASLNKSIMIIDSAFKYVSNNTITVLGIKNLRETATLRLDALSTNVSLLVNVTLLDCPPGYILDISGERCNCGASSYYGILKCEPEVHILHGIWIGPCNNNTIFCTSDCPLGYCTHDGKERQTAHAVPIPMNASQLEKSICSPTRTGTVCGQCIGNHSVYFNSWRFECGRNDYCHLGPIFFILSTLLPITILFLVIIIFDTNFASGWNGFFLYCQMLNSTYILANGIISFPNVQYKIFSWLMFIYSFFNLDIFNIDQLSFCIWKGATVMDILVIKLSSICYAFVLVLLTVYILKQRTLTKYCPCLLRRRYTLINGVSAFLILCYSQCARVCFQMLDAVCLYDDSFRCSKSILFYSADMERFRGANIKYASVAIVFLILIVILPPALLIFYPLFFRVLGKWNLSESRVATYLWRIMPIQLLDSFQNPFKDNYRCFAGLYFLYRTIALAIYAYMKIWVHYYWCALLQLWIIIVIHAIFLPYKKRLYNVIDILLFFNLTMVHGISLYLYMVSINKSFLGISLSHAFFWMTLQVMLLLFPLICAGIIIIKKWMILLKKTVCVTKRSTYEAIEPVPG